MEVIPLPQRQPRARRAQKIVEVVVPKPKKKKKRNKRRIGLSYAKQITAPRQLIASNPQLSQQFEAKKSMKSAGQRLSRISGKYTTQNFEKIILSIVAPGVNSAVKWADKFSSMQTTTANPWQVIQCPWFITGDTQTSLAMAQTDSFFAVFRNPQRAWIMYDPNKAAQTFQYQLYGCTPTAGSAFILIAPAVSWVFAPRLAYNQVIPLHIPYMLATSTYQPHGGLVYAGKASGDEFRRFFWFDSASSGTASTITGTINSVAAGATVAVQLDMWNKNGDIALGTFTSTAITTGTPAFSITFVANTSAYYSLSVTCTVGPTAGTNALSGPSTIANLLFQGACSVYQHHCIPDFDTNMNVVDGLRIMGASVMYTNTAPDINKNGEITGYQAPEETDWTEFAGANQQGLARLNKSQGKVILGIKEGMYEWMKITQPSDFNIKTFVDTRDGVLYDSYWPLENESSYLVLYPTVPTPTGAAGFYTLAFALEYQTTNTWRPVSYCDTSEMDWDLALNHLRNIPQITTNSMHLRDIGKAIGTIAKTLIGGLIKYGPGAIDLASRFAPVLGS